MLWLANPCHIEQRWRDVNIGHNVINGLAALKLFRTAHHHGDPDRSIVGAPLVNQSMFPKQKPIVPEIEDQCLVQFSPGLKKLHDPTCTFINCFDRLTVTLVIGLNVQVGIVGEFDPMSTVALMLHPSRDIGELVGAFKPAFGSLKRSIFIREGVTVRWDKVGMDRLV